MSRRPLSDMHGQPVSEHVDPTANVIALSAAAHKRQDDLREMHARLIEAKLKTVKVEARLRADALKAAQALTNTHDREMRHAEQMRLDAVRAIDVGASKTESERALQAINTLAATNKTDAENLRNALNNTAATMAKQVSDVADALGKQTASSFQELSTRVAALEKFQYEGQGKQTVIDPQTARLTIAVDRLTEGRKSDEGKSAGISMAWVALGGFVALVSGLMGIAGVLYAVLKP